MALTLLLLRLLLLLLLLLPVLRLSLLLLLLPRPSLGPRWAHGRSLVCCLDFLADLRVTPLSRMMSDDELSVG